MEGWRDGGAEGGGGGGGERSMRGIRHSIHCIQLGTERYRVLQEETHHGQIIQSLSSPEDAK